MTYEISRFGSLFLGTVRQWMKTDPRLRQMCTDEQQYLSLQLPLIPKQGIYRAGFTRTLPVLAVCSVARASSRNWRSGRCRVLHVDWRVLLVTFV